VCDHLHAKLRGWRQYFRYGTVARAYQIVNRYVERRVRNFLRQRHHHATSGARRFPCESIFGELGVLRLARR
jgi:RNA-directed DNA polymerase